MIEISPELYADFVDCSTRMTITKTYISNTKNIDKNTLRIILGQEPIKEENNND